jgi:nucleotide sugar dehydrogenase
MIAYDPRIAIIGYGHVGRNLTATFPDALIYDKHLDPYSGNRNLINTADIAFVCVPTPPTHGGSADMTAIDEVFSWLRTSWIVIRSTVPPGTTEQLRQRHNRPVVFWPEYIGEWAYAVPWERSPTGWPFVLLGGRPGDTSPLIPWLARVYGAERTYRQADAKTVELCKYMDNAWLASQILFANEFSRIADAFAVNYWELRELWALDPRVTKHNTAVHQQAPGFGGKCLPKDMRAIIAAATEAGYMPQLLVAYREYNDAIRRNEITEH